MMANKDLHNNMPYENFCWGILLLPYYPYFSGGPYHVYQNVCGQCKSYE